MVYIVQKDSEMKPFSQANLQPRLIRNLLPIFFSQTTLATHSCGGRGLYPALDSRIVAACIGKFYYMNIYNIKLLTD